MLAFTQISQRLQSLIYEAAGNTTIELHIQSIQFKFVLKKTLLNVSFTINC